MPRRTLSTVAVAAWLLATASTASAAPPSNDDFERAAPLDGRVTGTFDEATRQEDEPAHGAQTVWYAYRPPPPDGWRSICCGRPSTPASRSTPARA